MFNLDELTDVLLENIKNLFFPEAWVEIDLKFSKTEIFTLLYLDKKKEITMTELVEYIHSPMSTATGIVDRLVKSGYVVRERSETDRRVVVLKLTETGAALIGQVKTSIFGYVKDVLEELSGAEQEFLLQIVFKLLEGMQKKLGNKVQNQDNPDPIKKINIE